MNEPTIRNIPSPIELTEAEQLWLDLRWRLLQSIVVVDSVPPDQILVVNQRGISPLREAYTAWMIAQARRSL